MENPPSCLPMRSCPACTDVACLLFVIEGLSCQYRQTETLQGC